ncbi:unnamed protein product, partial [Rotaria sp. Silwood1]
MADNQNLFKGTRDLLITLLEKERQQFPEKFSKPVYVLPTIDDDANYDLEQCLRQERKYHYGERANLILYCVKPAHWSGILIEFEANEQILRAEYIDPIEGYDVVPEKIQKQFTNIYPFAVLQSRNMLKNKDATFSSALTIKTLLEAVKSCQRTSVDDKTIKDTEERIQHFQERGQQREAANETEVLHELQQLKSLFDKIQTSINPELDLNALREQLSKGLEEFKIESLNELSQEINRTKERIPSLQRRGRTKEAEDEIQFLHKLEKLKEIADKIGLNADMPISSISQFGSVLPPNIDNAIPEDPEKKHLYIKELLEEIEAMPHCARKTIFEFLMYFEKCLLGEECYLQDDKTLISSTQKLQEQLKKEELLSGDAKIIVNNLELYIINRNYSAIVKCLNELLKKIRPLNVREIQKLVSQAEKAAELIRNKDIILLIGETGSGKSTTIQFLAGATMGQTQVKIGPGKYLEHITSIGPIKNSALINITSSPLQRSETRYIAPVTIQLRNVLGATGNGEITLCDAPGFDDRGGPEVNIANSIGVMEAINGTRSVKLLALSSYLSLGDKGQGIQKLAHILISMVNGIDDRLDAILYAFTKYPKEVNINARLTSILQETETSNSTTKIDTIFQKVLEDMVEKTADDVFRIEPLGEVPKKLIRTLKKIPDIKNPGEVFRLSMSETTRASLSDHVQRDRLSIIYAMKYKDVDLTLYYLNDLYILKSLVKENFIRDTYAESVRFVSETISDYCTDMIKKFNHALVSQDGLKEKDILDYKASIEYLEQAQILKKHLESHLLSPAALTQNIISELNEISHNLTQATLNSPLVTVYLDNLRMMKTSFMELEETYKNSCKKFEKSFFDLVENARELIPTNNFKKIAEILLNIFQSARAVKNHLDSQVQGAYRDLVRYLLQYLSSFSDQAELLFAKIRLNNEELDMIKRSIEILRSAKENAALQERVSIYLEMLTTNNESLFVYCKNQFSEKYIQNLNDIYDDYIVR